PTPNGTSSTSSKSSSLRAIDKTLRTRAGGTRPTTPAIQGPAAVHTARIEAGSASNPGAGAEVAGPLPWTGSRLRNENSNPSALAVPHADRHLRHEPLQDVRLRPEGSQEHQPGHPPWRDLRAARPQ